DADHAEGGEPEHALVPQLPPGPGVPDPPAGQGLRSGLDAVREPGRARKATGGGVPRPEPVPDDELLDVPQVEPAKRVAQSAWRRGGKLTSEGKSKECLGRGVRALRATRFAPCPTPGEQSGG